MESMHVVILCGQLGDDINIVSVIDIASNNETFTFDLGKTAVPWKSATMDMFW
jgi:hypothetical protein